MKESAMPGREELLMKAGTVFGGEDAEREARRRLINWYECALMETETKLQVLNNEFSMRYDRNPIAGISGRIKSPESIRSKLAAKGLAPTAENIENALDDVAGVRVICSFTDDVYALEKALLAQDDVKLIERIDYIASPKAGGYRSLHLVIGVPIFLSREKRIMKVEIQLRTIAMDAWATSSTSSAIKRTLRLRRRSTARSVTARASSGNLTGR